MASGQTKNYNLNQWEAGDQVLRTEFNADNAKIDATLGTIPKIVTGTYTGNGAASQDIFLSFTPKTVYLCTNEGEAYHGFSSGYVYGGLALAGLPLVNDVGTVYTAMEIIPNGFRAYYKMIDNYSGVYCNQNNITYYYIAIG